MPREVGGKIFYTREEAEAAGIKLPTPEEFARNQAILDQFDADIRAAAPPPEGVTPAGFGGRFSDDLEGTEWEGWTVVNGQWFDQHGNPVD
ncbi:hypothetical protein ACFYV7_24685 [Nocardia suismassiliense]|uniref:Uncharacterized protein n=1 Tax=Nocardia suismassiliense TaxID=2077092 RepID=A0ABW6QYC5_9NOCA